MAVLEIIKSYQVYYNGLDRKANDIDYTFDNCPPCCWDCNRAKHKSTYAEFMEYLNLFKP